MLIQLLISLDYLQCRVEVCYVVSKQDRRLIVGPDGISSSLDSNVGLGMVVSIKDSP
jgi:hypothetical protein